MKNLNEYQFHEWRPHVYEEEADYGHMGMIESFARQGRFDEAMESITREKTGTWAWEWVNPSRRGYITQDIPADSEGRELSRDERETYDEELHGPLRHSFGHSSRRKAWENAMDWMIDYTGGKPEKLSSYGGEMTLDDEEVQKWENFHKSQGHEIKYKWS